MSKKATDAEGGATATDYKTSLLFRDINPLLFIGARRPLEKQDLPVLPSALASDHSLKVLRRHALSPSKDDDADTISWLETPPDLKTSRAALRSLLGLFWRAYGDAFLVLGLLKIFLLCSAFMGPLLLSQMVTYIEENEPSTSNLPKGLLLVSGLGASFIFSAVLNTQFNIRSSLLQLTMKGALINAVFNRALSLPAFGCADLGLCDGKMMTLIQIDVDRVSGCASSLHDLWMLPVQIVVTFVLLYQQVQSAFIAGIIIIIVMIPINKSITQRIMTSTKGQMRCKDQRVTLVSEAVRGMRSVKMLGLEEVVAELSTERRAEELIFLSQRKYLDAVCVFLWASLPVLVPFSTFAVSTCLLHRRLSAPEVFTTIALLNMLIFPMNALPWVLNGCAEAGVSLQRVAKLLSDKAGRMSMGEESVDSTPNDDDVEDDDENDEDGKDKGGREGEVKKAATVRVDSTNLLSVRGAQWIWTPPYVEAATVPPPPVSRCCGIFGQTRPNSASDGEGVGDVEKGKDPDVNNKPFSLPLISFNGQGGRVYALVGSVASGKSTMLAGVLGQVRSIASTKGHVRIVGVPLEAHSTCNVAVAFCPQQPLMHAGSVRSNILFGSPMDGARYRRVLQGCCLDPDVAAWSPAGDLTSVGHSGGALSGGQKLRIGIARALYSRSRIVLLDSPFSALDADTASRLLSFIETEASEAGRCILLASHSVNFLRGRVEGVMLMQRGLACEQGSFSDMETRSKVFQSLLKEEKEIKNRDDDSVVVSVTTALESGSEIDELPSHKMPKEGVVAADTAQEQSEPDPIEAMATGRIGINVYFEYFSAASPVTCLLVLIFTMGMEASADGMSIWYAYWADHSQELSDERFLMLTGGLAGINVACALLRSYLFAYGGLRAARRLYAALTKSVLSTNLGFFEKTSVGRVLNRFGKDTDTIDDSLPFMINIVLAQTFVLIGSFAVISYSNPPILVMLAIVGLLYWRLQNFYRASSRGLRRLDAILRSPVYTILQDCLSNVTSIRAMRREQAFKRQLAVALDGMIQVALTQAVASQWLNMRLQLLGAVIATSVALLSTVGTATGLLQVSPALLGVSLVYSLSLVSKLNGLVGSLTETEQEMVSVERCREYLNLPSEFEPPVQREVTGKDSEDLRTPLLDGDAEEGETSPHALHQRMPPPEWPAYGAISFSGVRMRYSPESPEALKGISVNVDAGNRVAVIGRTGSGKSTLLRVLLGINEYHSGSITIDGVELRSVPKRVLRDKISVIPQDPFLITGPLRLSLDPWKKHGQVRMEEALTACGFVETMRDAARSLSQSDDTCKGQQPLAATSASELLDMPLVDGGSNLSLGQKQLLCLGRALLRGSRIVLLDEFSSSIDAQAEARLYEVLEKSLAESGSTLLVITHRTPPASCGKLLTLSGGNVAHFGSTNL